MSTPLSPARSRRYGWIGRLVGLALVAVVSLAAATTAPSPAEPAPADGPPVETLRLHTDGDGATEAEARVQSAQSDTTEVVEVADEMPEIIGGLASVQERIVYPELQRRAGVEGTAILQFIVSEEGTVEDLVVARSSGNDGLDRAAMAAVRPTRFTPGKVDGEPVRVRFALPISFRLPPDADERSDDRVREVRPDPEGEDGVFGVVDDMPQLIGGLAGLQERLVYPQLAKDAGIEGQVVVQFIVNEEGRVQDAVVLRSPDDMLSEAALQAVRASRFEPGRIGDEAVKVRFAVPIMFRLPAGDGVDRGERRDRDRTERAVRYAGIDVSRLTPGSRQAFETTLSDLPEILGRRSQAPGDVEVRYTVGPDGRNGGAEYVAGDRSLLPLAAGLVGTLVTAEDARPGPGGAWTGTFRLWYVGQG